MSEVPERIKKNPAAQLEFISIIWGYHKQLYTLSEVFKDKALFYEVGDYGQLVRNIEQYYRSPEMIVKYRQACQEMVRTTYSSVVIDDQLKDLFASV